MESPLAIELRDVSKSFRIEVEDGSREKKLFNKISTSIIENKVLDGINLQVRKGEILGIIGLNGSGKSTLLSIMARIMEPDKGEVLISGKVSSILELGMGFHPDLSGRENIYLKGKMYGFSRKQISERIDEIIDFSGIRHFIDAPLRTYSSGMKARLAFSVMVSVDAEVMLLDEIMSTGDPSFTTKADLLFRRQLKDGKTVVFASQNIVQIEQMCSRVIWISNGKIVLDGPAKHVCSKYKNTINESIDIVAGLANEGISESQYKLALMYRDGKGVERDAELYRAWLYRAASQGHPQAQVAYADLLMDSDSEQDWADAQAFYQSAAAKGNSDAKLKISAMASKNKSNADREEILDIWKQLADVGHPSNKFQYGMLLLRSALSDDDRAEAFNWFVKYAEEGSPESNLQVANMYLNGLGTSKDTDEYIHYLSKAATMGSVEAIKQLADVYLNGKIVLKDESKAFELYLKGATMGHPGMQYQVAVMYRDGMGTEVDLQESEKWFAAYSESNLASFQIVAADQLKTFEINTSATPESLLEKAATAFNPKAISLLAGLYRGDGGYASNLELSKRYYELSAYFPGGPRLNLADMYYRGVIFEQDYSKAAELYKDLTYTCDATIDFRLYQMYSKGQGFEKDLDAANYYLKRSATRGNCDARLLLKRLNSCHTNQK